MAKDYVIGTLHIPIAPKVVKIVSTAYEKLGHEVEIKYLPPMRSLVEANAGRVDGELGRMPVIEPNYPNLMRVPVTIVEFDFVAIKLKDTKGFIEHWDNLKERSTTRPLGIRFLDRFAEEYGMDSAPDMESVVSQILNKRVEFGVLLAADAERFIQEYDRLTISSDILATGKIYHYVHKKNKDLIEPLTKALIEMRDAGEFQRFLASD